MARTVTNYTTIGLITEVTPGTTPATPALQQIRATSENFSVDRSFAKSAQFNPSGQINDQLLTRHAATGGFSFEWADGEVGIETLLESCLWGTFATDVLNSGTTKKSLTFDIKYEAGATDQYKRFTGMCGEELNLDFKAGEIITGSMAFLGMSSTFVTTGITGATTPAFGTEPVNVAGDMSLTSSGITVDAVTSLSIRLKNNCRGHYVLGSFTPTEIAPGDSVLTGDIEFYLNAGSADQITAYLANASFTLAATAGNTTLKKTRFDVLKAKFNKLDVMAAANGQDLMIKGQWEGFNTSTATPNVRVTRNIA